MRIGSSLGPLANQAANTARLNDVYRQGSSGSRITSAADGPAGLIISQQMRAQVTGLNQATENTETAVAMAQTAEGALGETSNLLTRARELLLQTANSGAMSPDQVTANRQELANIGASIDRIAETTRFGNKPLLDQNQTLSFQTGADAGQQMSLELEASDSAALGLDGLQDPTAIGEDGNGASELLAAVDDAINQVATVRGRIGAFQSNGLETTASSLRASAENLTAAGSLIADIDFAQLAASKAQEEIRSQVGIAMLAQGNQQAGQVLRLLPGQG